MRSILFLIEELWNDLGKNSKGIETRGFMADQMMEGSQPVDLSKHPSGIVPTLQYVLLRFMFAMYLAK